jgi:DNA recombination-dependent growth factor C
MGLINGSITYKKFTVTDELPKNFKEALIKELPRHVFRDINPKTNPETSMGWVNVTDPLDTDLGLEKILFGKYIILGFRKDKKAISGTLFKAQVNDAIKAQMRQRHGRKLSREEIASLKEVLKEKLLESTSPTISLFEMVWNYETQEVFFSSQASKPAAEFADHFLETFGLNIDEVTVSGITEGFIDKSGIDLELAQLESSNFGS